MTHITAPRPITHRQMGRDNGSLRTNRQPFRTPTRTPRLLMRKRGTRPGHVDGSWWPWTANLTAELHDLITVVTPRLGPTVRIGYDWNATSLTQRRIDDDDGILMHGPGSTQPPDIMHLYGSHGASLVLLVIPFDTQPELAQRQMGLASGAHEQPFHPTATAS